MSDRDFFDVADRFVHLANELVAEHGNERVSATLLFAAARFNAHTFHASDGDPSHREAAVEYFCEQYRKMLLDNLDELGPDAD